MNILKKQIAIKPISTPFANRRVTFIDLLRAYAILMMLQGHFTDTLLASAYRDHSNFIYATWYFMRGMTAPIFFFASGLIFVFLLMRDKAPLGENVRVKKGIRRGIELIAIGYILRLSFPQLLTFHIYPGLFAVDVLHCIGLSLLSLTGIFALSRWLRLSYPTLLGVGGALAFYFYFDFKNADWTFLPLALENYFTQSNGSVFTPIPWVGYAMLGGVLGYALNRRPQWAFGQILPLALLAGGLFIHYCSSWVLTQLYEVTGWQTFLAHANFNFLAWRLGHVFISVALFIWIAQLWQNIPKLLLRIGSETLVIYEVHFVLLYGTWFGVGLSTFWYRSLTPWQTVFGTALFILFFFLLTANIDRIRQYRWPWWRERIEKAAHGRFKWALEHVWRPIFGLKNDTFYLQTRPPTMLLEAVQAVWEKAVLAWRIARIRTVRWYLRQVYRGYRASGEE